MGRPRAFLIGNPSKPTVGPVFDELRAWMPARTDLVGGSLDIAVQEILAARPDRIIVLGGDGTLLAVAGALGPSQTPLVGVNLGKLGYLADFTVNELQANLERVMTDPSLVTARMTLDIQVETGPSSTVHERSVNDSVIRDGAPFRMIQLAISVDGEFLTEMSGDGLIIATPTGSTAHNMSAGGPILHPETRGIVLTPICPHALTYRPLVVESSLTIEITAKQVNEGTVVSVDGQRTIPLQKGRKVLVRRSPHDFLLVRNPTFPRWHTLVRKLKWGVSPTAS